MKNQNQEVEKVGLVDVVKASNYKALIPFGGLWAFDKAARGIEWKTERMPNGDLERVRTGKKVGLESHLGKMAYQVLAMSASLYGFGYAMAKLTEM